MSTIMMMEGDNGEGISNCSVPTKKTNTNSRHCERTKQSSPLNMKIADIWIATPQITNQISTS